jgi:hypothetical protein
MCDVPCNIEVTHVDPILHNKNRIICIESDQNINFRFYMPFHIIIVTYVDPILDDSVAM